MPDFAKLYSSLHTTWDKVRVDILSHIFLLVACLIAGVRLPHISLPSLDAAAVMNWPSYKLAKDTNALLLVPVVLALAVIVYGVVMRTLGQSLSAVVVTSLQNRSVSPFIAGSVRVPDLVTLASVIRRPDFDESDLSDAVTAATLRYAAKKDPDFQRLQPGDQNKDASLYLGYAMLFVIGWCALFFWLPGDSAWRTQNNRTFWPVLLLLLLLLVRNLIKLREFVLLLPASLLFFLAYKVRTDPTMSSTLDDARPRLPAIEARVESLRLAALRRAAAPSLYRFFAATLNGDTPRESSHTTQRFWLHRVYDEGRSFSVGDDKTKYESRWLEFFAKYVVYRVSETLLQLLMVIAGLLLRVAGLNEWLQRVTSRNLEIATLSLAETLNASPAEAAADDSASRTV